MLGWVSVGVGECGCVSVGVEERWCGHWCGGRGGCGG